MMCDMEKKKLAVIGNGYLAGILAQAWEKGLLESYRFVGVLGRNREKTEALARRLGYRPAGPYDAWELYRSPHTQKDGEGLFPPEKPNNP